MACANVVFEPPEAFKHGKGRKACLFVCLFVCSFVRSFVSSEVFSLFDNMAFVSLVDWLFVCFFDKHWIILSGVSKWVKRRLAANSCAAQGACALIWFG